MSFPSTFNTSPSIETIPEWWKKAEKLFSVGKDYEKKIWEIHKNSLQKCTIYWDQEQRIYFDAFFPNKNDEEEAFIHSLNLLIKNTRIDLENKQGSLKRTKSLYNLRGFSRKPSLHSSKSMNDFQVKAIKLTKSLKKT